MNNEWATRLNTALLGRPADWRFTGNAQERKNCDGECACGHCGLKFMFQLEDIITKATVWVGSTCIETYRQAMPSAVHNIAKTLKRLKKNAKYRKEFEHGLAKWKDAPDSHASKQMMIEYYQAGITRLTAV